MLVTTLFSTLSSREIIILTTSILSSANAFNFDCHQAEILSFGKRVNTKSEFLTTLEKERLLKILLEKQKLMVTNIFSFSNNAIYFVKEKDHHKF